MPGEAVKLMVLFLGSLSIRYTPNPEPLNLNRLEGKAQETPRAWLAAVAKPLALAVLRNLCILCMFHVSTFLVFCVGVCFVGGEVVEGRV